MRLQARLAAPIAAIALSFGVLPTLAVAAPADDTPTLLNVKGEHESGADEAGLEKLRDAYYWSGLLAGDQRLTLTQAATLRQAASKQAKKLSTATTKGATRGGTWTSVGPDPIVQNARTSNNFQAVSGRVGALAMRHDGSIILGAAQGGIWTYDPATKTWTSRFNDSDTQAIGALAVAPSDDRIVYAGSGEGALSGDSYYGSGVYKSTDGGVTWSHVSTKFTGSSVAKIVVDPTTPTHLYAATLRGRGGNHRTTAPTSSPYGVWESRDGGATWTPKKTTTNERHGATDLVMDPQDPTHLWASFWGEAIYASTDGGATWTSALGNLPAGNFLEGGTRFSLGLSHPVGKPNTLYVGYDYFDLSDTYHPGTIWKSVDGGTTWTNSTGTPTSGSNSVVNYCTTQCFYDNVVAPDPANPDVVYVLGSYGYSNSPQSGGVYRSTDGGATWRSLGYDLHPDFHAFAYQPGNSQHVAVGNDGGVWQSQDGGGRYGTPLPALSTVTWENLNGTVNPTTAALIHSTGLRITQFSSIATVPAVPGQYWGGTQDNGTLRKSLANSRWFDQASGDGGQVIVDQTTPNPLTTSFPAYVYGTYFGISPYRYDPSEVNTFFGNETIDGGIDTKDRAEFYVPWTQNRGNTNQMFLGTYRLYRTDNAKAPSAGDVTWAPISGDLTSGCAGAAPNGARGCLISAVSVADGGDGVWVGTDDGIVQVSPDAVTSDSPSWSRVGATVIPNRPVDQIATDRSNWRIAYVAMGGFGMATPKHPGHVFATDDGGRTWRNASANLPDVPANTIVIDPSDSRIIYVGTDVGNFVSTNGGRHYKRLGTGMPTVATWQLDYDATNGVLIAGTHGRGAYTLANRSASAALVVSKTDAGTPVGPGSTVNYTITVKNIGNATATGVTITDRIPARTRFVSASDGGTYSGGTVTWRGKSIPAGGSLSLTFKVQIASALPAGTTSIVNDGITVRAKGGVYTTGSPHATTIAAAHDVSVTPATATGGAKVGTQASYVEHVTNEGYLSDSYALTTSGTWTTTTYDPTCTTPLATTPTVAPGASTDVCVKVSVPAGAAEAATSVSTLTATSVGDPSVHASATLTTYAAAVATLLVDGDGNAPDVSAKYKAAMGATPYGIWDLLANPSLPQGYLTGHTSVVWWTGNSYPAPITPYESQLKAFLDGGGRLMLSGQDILDQGAGTTDFVHDYLHVAWDGTETQNDKATAHVTAVTGNPVSNGLGSVVLDHSVLNANFEDQITPVAPAASAFTDDTGATNGLTVAAGAYKVVFLAFPFEGYGTASNQSTLMGRTLTWFAAP